MKLLVVCAGLGGASAADGWLYEAAQAKVIVDLYEAGLVDEIFRQAGGIGTILVMNCASAAEARQLLEGFPLVKAGLQECEVTPLAACRESAELFHRRQLRLPPWWPDES